MHKLWNRKKITMSECSLIGGETENLSWTQKSPTRFVIETFQLITLAVCCGYVSNLIGRRTINIPEIILGVHGLMGFTVKYPPVTMRHIWQLGWVNTSTGYISFDLNEDRKSQCTLAQILMFDDTRNCFFF